MKLVDKRITLPELKKMSSRMFGGLVKAVIDVRKGIMVLDAAMHADEEKYMLDAGSIQDDLWGINLYPDMEGEDFVEFDSMINIRPRLNNLSLKIQNKAIREKITKIVSRLVVR